MMNEKKPVPILSDFNTMALVLIPIGIGINYVGGLIVKALQLPIYLDAIGTLIVGIIAGPWVGAVTGALANVIFGLTVDPIFLPYLIVNLAFGLAAGFMARANWFERWQPVWAAGLVIFALGVVLSAPINVFFFGGVPESPTASVIWTYFIAIGANLWESVIATSVLREIADKFISVFVAYGVYKAFPKRFLLKFPGYIRKSKAA